MKKNSGFTVLELVITAALVAIIFAVAIPSMTTFTQNDRLTTNINQLIGHLAYARSESVKMNAQVALCVSNNSVGCTGGDWQDGWLVYVDQDANNSFDAGETILRVQQALEGGNRIVATMGNQIVYDNRGFAAQGSAGSLQLCDTRTGAHGKTLTISNTGRVRVQDKTAC